MRCYDWSIINQWGFPPRGWRFENSSTQEWVPDGSVILAPCLKNTDAVRASMRPYNTHIKPYFHPNMLKNMLRRSFTTATPPPPPPPPPPSASHHARLLVCSNSLQLTLTIIPLLEKKKGRHACKETSKKKSSPTFTNTTRSCKKKCRYSYNPLIFFVLLAHSPLQPLSQLSK